MTNENTQELKILILKTLKNFYSEKSLSFQEMRYLASLIICDLGFIEDNYDENMFNYGRKLDC